MELPSKTLMVGKIGGRRRRWQQRTRWLDGITDSTDRTLSQLREMVEDGEPWHTAVHRLAESATTSERQGEENPELNLHPRGGGRALTSCTAHLGRNRIIQYSSGNGLVVTSSQLQARVST